MSRPEATTHDLVVIARRWRDERDAVVSRDRIATSAFAIGGAMRPGHNKFLEPMNACIDQLFRAFGGELSHADWVALSELVSGAAARIAYLSPPTENNLNRQALTPRGPLVGEAIDPDNPDTWDVPD